MEILKIGTINVATEDAQKAGALFRALGLAAKTEDLVRLEEPPAQIRYLQLPIGESSLSLVEPSDKTSPIAKFLERRGEGIFSVNLEVEGLDEIMAAWSKHGVRWVLEKAMDFGPAPGRPYSGKVNWTKPATTHGILLELTEKFR